jgi:uncharacterized membrane protein YhhN
MAERRPATTTALAFAALCTLYLLFFEYNASWIGAAFKAAPILLLCVAAAREAQGAWRTGLVVALLFSALGDVLLAAHAMRGGLFTAGLGSFLVAQLAYAQLFWRHRGTARWRWWLALAWLPVAVALGWQVLPQAGSLAGAVGLYMLAITAMVTGAALADRPLWLFAGALSFAFSDGAIAVNKFLYPLPHAGLVIMLSYYLAQGLLWWGATRAPVEVRG